MSFTDQEIDRIIEMAWEDRTPFEAIYFQFNLSEQEVIDLMRRELKEKVGRGGVKEFKEEKQNILNYGQMKFNDISLLGKSKLLEIGFLKGYK